MNINKNQIMIRLLAQNLIMLLTMACIIGLWPWSSTGATIDYNIAVLRGLNKITGQVSLLRVMVGTPIQFGQITIDVHACDKKPPEESPDAAVWLALYERPSGTKLERGETLQSVFSGWMFSASPALSALDHPVYDIRLLDCDHR